jgi:hypothetical protein
MCNDKNLTNYLKLGNHHLSNNFIEDQNLNC